MGAYGKSSQPMNTAWLIARKMDRMDIGEYSPVAMFRKLEAWYWGVRALNPSETQDDEDARRKECGETFKTIPELLESVNTRITFLHTPDSKLRMHEDSLNLADVDIENQIAGIGSELWEITVRCKLIDNVRVTEEAAP